MKVHRVLFSCILLLGASVVAAGQSGVSSAAVQPAPSVSTPYQILKSPHAKHPPAAVWRGIGGSVRLKIDLLANGKIGLIRDVTPERKEEMVKLGFTESAIKAAQKIKFKPRTVNGIPVSATIVREYTFNVF